VVQILFRPCNSNKQRQLQPYRLTHSSFETTCEIFMSAEFYMVFSTYTQSFSVVRAKSSPPCELALLVFFLSFCVAERFTGPRGVRSAVVEVAACPLLSQPGAQLAQCFIARCDFRPSGRFLFLSLLVVSFSSGLSSVIRFCAPQLSLCSSVV